MQKLYSLQLLLVMSFSGITTSAQNVYHKLLAPGVTDWYIFHDGIAVKPGSAVTNTVSFYLSSGKYSAYTDTTVLGNDYKKMHWMYQTPGPSTPQHLGYIREDTIARKVYFLDKEGSAEDLLYDFSLTAGATTQLDFPGAFGSFPAGSYTVTTVDSVMTRVGYRKQLKLLNTSSDTLVYIESIGSIIHPLYLYGYFFQGGYFMWGSPDCSYLYDMGLACKESDDEKYYQSCTYTLAEMNNCIYKYDSCNYFSNCSAIEEIGSIVKCNLLPNPASEKVSLELETKQTSFVTVDLCDITGKKAKTLFNGNVATGKATINMELGNMENGYYFLKIYSKDFNIDRPIVISR